MLVFLLNSRYCEVDLLSPAAFDLFGHLPPGGSRVHAVVEWVNKKVTFGYQYARATKTALDVYTERVGVCRDYQHLAVAFCRALNIPARYVAGYLGDIGVPYTWPDGFQRLVRSLPRRQMVDLRRPPQQAAYRTSAHGHRPRRRRRGVPDFVRHGDDDEV